MVGWKVWAMPAKVGLPGDWELHGKYNSRGIRVK
jgi:hypothetical protein